MHDDYDGDLFFSGVVNALLITAVLGGVAAWLIHLF